MVPAVVQVQGGVRQFGVWWLGVQPIWKSVLSVGKFAGPGWGLEHMVRLLYGGCCTVRHECSVCSACDTGVRMKQHKDSAWGVSVGVLACRLCG